MITLSQKEYRRPKHIPQRTCIGCRGIKPKRELIRIVLAPSGTIEIDITGKKSGRGVYLCKAQGCWQAGLKKERLDRALRTKIATESLKELIKYGEMLPRSGD